MSTDSVVPVASIFSTCSRTQSVGLGAIGQRRALPAARKEHHFAELERALLQGSRPASERDEPLAGVFAAMRPAVPKGVEGAPRSLVRI